MKTERMSARFGAIGMTALVAAAICTAAATLSSFAAGPLSSISDVRVAPLLTTTWGQTGAGGTSGPACYNYYTPNRYQCGCVATAIAQIMYYHRYPTERIYPGETLYASVNKAERGDNAGGWSVAPDGTGSYTLYKDGPSTPFSPDYGGPYDWSSMVASPTSATSENSRKAIGLLTRDVGLAAFSDYNVTSGETSGFVAASSIILNLHYADAVKSDFDANKLIANLDAGLPVYVNITAPHAVVVDGYGYHNGKLYLHINYGYSGNQDGWYDTTTDINGATLAGMVANIFPPTRGARHSSVISGRVLDANGAPVANATVTAAADGLATVTTNSNAKGTYAFILPAGEYTFTATSGGETGELLRCHVAASSQKTRAEFEDPYTQNGWQSGVNNSMSGVDVTLGRSANMNEPDEYLEYVESDGRQWIDTGVCPNANMTISADVDLMGNGIFMGVSHYESYPIECKDGFIAGRLLRSEYATTSVPTNTGRHKIVASSSALNDRFTVSVDGGAAVQSTWNVDVQSASVSMYVFAGQFDTTLGACPAKLYRLKITVNGELVRNFVPARKNGVAGLYDRLNDVWYASGSGTPLSAGPVVAFISENEPDEYLEYVESDGRQWVDLSNLTQTATMTFDADMEWKSDANEATFIGQSWHARNLFMVKDGTIRCMWFMGDNYAPADTGVRPGDGQRHRFVVTAQQGQKLSVTVDGGTPVYTANNSDRAINNPDNQSLYLFAQHQGDGSTVGNYSSVKLYGLKIYDGNGELVRDFVPGIKNDVAGLDDRQNDAWYASGSGTSLIAGPVYVHSTARQATLKVSGYRRQEAIENFQALVKLSEGDAYGFSYADCVAADGSDLWFEDAEGNLIPHDIDTWNPDGDSYVWVKIPTLTPNATITMHWGEARTAEQTCTPSDTWSGYVGVWHMNATGTTSEPDSTSHGLSAVPLTSGNASTSLNTGAGAVGSGRNVAQSTLFKVSSHSGHLSSASVFTIGGWIKKTTDGGQYPRIFVGNPSNSDRTKWEVFAQSDTDVRARGGSTELVASSGIDVSASADWNYLTVVFNGTTASLYNKGVLVMSGTIGTASQGSYFTIGAPGSTSDRSFVGIFDEVRMYDGVLSADRVAADYATMNNPTNFLTLYVPPQNEPDAYLDYVASDGKQVIDTGVTPGPTTSVTPAITSMIVDADVDWISGTVVVGSTWNNFEPLKSFNGKIGGFVKNSNNTQTGYDLNSGRHHVVSTAVQGQKLTIDVDGVRTTSSGNVVANSSLRKLYVFATNDGTTGGSDHSTVKLYGLKIYINDELVRDFVPGIKDGVAGLYDRLNDAWYHSGSGIELIPGPVTEPRNAPDVYLDYVKSTGTQWVSIGLTPSRTMTFDVDLDWISGNTAIGQNHYDLYPLKMESGSVCSAWWGSGWANTGVRQDTGRHRFVVTTVDSQKVSTRVDGGEAAQSGGTSSRGDVKPYDLYVFGSHVGPTANQSGDLSTMKLYGLKIYGANGALARDYVPGIKDNVVGLYDRAGDKFYSSGSGTPLEAGPVIDRSKPDAFVEYVQANGNQYVDTGVDGRANIKSEMDAEWTEGNCLLGSHSGGGNQNLCLLLQNLSGIGGQAGNSGEAKSLVSLNAVRHLMVSEAMGGEKFKVTVDGGTPATSGGNVSTGLNNGRSIWVFASNNSGSPWGNSKGKVYGLKLWRTGADGVCRIQRHFIPCVKDNRAGLYDAVSGVIFYSHSGTDLSASPTTRTLSVWRNEADDASLDNAANWCGGLPDGTDAVVCAPWVPSVSTTNGLAFADLTVSGGDLAFADGTHTVAGALAADGVLTFTNLVINGSADCGVAVSGFISGHGTVASLTLAEGAAFKPDGTDYLTVSDSLTGTMLIDLSDLALESMTQVPLFKTGTAAILPAANAVRFVGGRPGSWNLRAVRQGYGYDLRKGGIAIFVR